MKTTQPLPFAPAQLDQIPEFLGQVISDLILLIPRLIGALIILLIGWFIGRIVARVVSTLADRTEIDRRTMKTPIGNMLGGTEQAVSNAFGKVAAYYIYFLAILAAADALQIPLLSQWIADAASYLPAFIAGLLIIVVGFIVADFVGDAIERSASTTGSRVGSLLASGVQVFLYFIVIVVGLDTMQIDVEILYIFASASPAASVSRSRSVSASRWGWADGTTSPRTSTTGPGRPVPRWTLQTRVPKRMGREVVQAARTPTSATKSEFESEREQLIPVPALALESFLSLRL